MYSRGVGNDKRDNLIETSDEAVLSLSCSGLNVNGRNIWFCLSGLNHEFLEQLVKLNCQLTVRILECAWWFLSLSLSLQWNNGCDIADFSAITIVSRQCNCLTWDAQSSLIARKKFSSSSLRTARDNRRTNASFLKIISTVISAAKQSSFDSIITTTAFSFWPNDPCRIESSHGEINWFADGKIAHYITDNDSASIRSVSNSSSFASNSYITSAKTLSITRHKSLSNASTSPHRQHAEGN